MQIIISVLPSEDKVTWERRSPEDTRRLTLDFAKCSGCGSCAMSCPQDAISMVAVGAEKKSNIVIDMDKCVFCKTCTTICPFDALELDIDGIKYKSTISGDFAADFVNKCERCLKCLDACPRDSLVFEIPKGGITKTKDGLVRRDEELCIYCARCEAACCDVKVISVKKPVRGSIKIDQELCVGCGTCIDACPTKNISFAAKTKMWDTVEPILIGENVSYAAGLNLLVNYHREIGEAKFNDYCIYCGKCELVCPVNAIKVDIEDFEKGIVGPWSEAIERREGKNKRPPLKQRKIDPEKCHACGDCVVACPVRGKVLKIVNGMVWLLDEDACTGCGICVDCCPGSAMKLYGPEIKRKTIIKEVPELLEIV
jgi:4Fe-4S ferredoxin